MTKSIHFEEGWKIDLTTRKAAVNRALGNIPIGTGRNFLKNYNEKQAFLLMNERGCVALRDFDSCFEDRYSFEELRRAIYWKVSLETWNESCSRADVLQVCRQYYDFLTPSMVEGPNVDQCQHSESIYLDICGRLWGLLLEEPQKLVHVRITESHRNRNNSGRDSDDSLDIVNLRTSVGNEYLLYTTTSRASDFLLFDLLD